MISNIQNTIKNYCSYLLYCKITHFGTGKPKAITLKFSSTRTSFHLSRSSFVYCYNFIKHYFLCFDCNSLIIYLLLLTIHRICSLVSVIFHLLGAFPYFLTDCLKLAGHFFRPSLCLLELKFYHALQLLQYSTI